MLLTGGSQLILRKLTGIFAFQLPILFVLSSFITRRIDAKEKSKKIMGIGN